MANLDFFCAIENNDKKRILRILRGSKTVDKQIHSTKLNQCAVWYMAFEWLVYEKCEYVCVGEYHAFEIWEVWKKAKRGKKKHN